MQVHDIGKVALIALLMIGVFTLVGTGKIDWNQALPILTANAAYLMGNGVLAVRGRAPSPMIVPNVDRGDVATTIGTVAVDVKRQADPEAPLHRIGDHQTGEHFLQPDPSPPQSWTVTPPIPDPPSWQAPQPGETPADVIGRLPHVPTAAGIYDPSPSPGYDAYMAGQLAPVVDQPDPQPLEWDAMCVCDHPRGDHVESVNHPGRALWCNNVAGDEARGVEARCACNMFNPNMNHPDNRQFWDRASEERHGNTT